MFAGIAAIAARRRSAEGEEREQLRLLLRAALVVGAAFVACLIGSLATPAVRSTSARSSRSCRWRSSRRRWRWRSCATACTGSTCSSTARSCSPRSPPCWAGSTSRPCSASGSALGQDVQLGAALIATALVAVAFQPLRDRVQRAVSRLLHGRRDEPYAAISTLGRRLGEAMAPTRVLPVMVETIGDELRLPYVAVELTDAPGEPAAVHGTPDAGVALRLPLVHAGERVGTLLIGARAHGEPLADADRRLLEDFAHRASAAASAVALSIEVQRSRERLVTAREEERRRLRGDLHDGLGPTLAGAVLTIDAARRLLATDPEAADTLLDRAAASLEGTVADVRRLVYGLRPPALDQLGLTGALRQHAAALSGAELGCEIAEPDPLPPLPAAVEAAAYPDRPGGAHERRAPRARAHGRRVDHGRRDAAARGRRRRLRPARPTGTPASGSPRCASARPSSAAASSSRPPRAAAPWSAWSCRCHRHDRSSNSATWRATASASVSVRLKTPGPARTRRRSVASAFRVGPPAGGRSRGPSLLARQARGARACPCRRRRPRCADRSTEARR